MLPKHCTNNTKHSNYNYTYYQNTVKSSTHYKTIVSLRVGSLVNFLTVSRSLGDDIHKNRTRKLITLSVIFPFFTIIITKIGEGLFSNTTRILTLQNPLVTVCTTRFKRTALFLVITQRVVVIGSTIKILHSAHRIYLCVSCVFRNRQ